MQFALVLAAALTAVSASPISPASPLVKREGINCHGSSQCSQGTAAVSRKLQGYIGQLDEKRWVQSGVQIACVREPHQGDANGAICAFMQGTLGAHGAEIQRLAAGIVDHGCNKCGSVPMEWPQNNDIKAKGMLTFNYVADGCGHSGLCI